MPRAISNLISAWPLVVKRSIAQWKLLSTVVIGVLLATTIMSGTVIYFEALRELALKNTLQGLTVEGATTAPTTIACKAYGGNDFP